MSASGNFNNTQVVLGAPATNYNADGDSGALDVSIFREVAVDIDVTVMTTAGTTLDLYVDRQGADGQWYQIWHGAQVVAVGTVSTSIGPGCAINESIGQTIRLRWVLGGAGAAFTFSSSIIGKH